MNCLWLVTFQCIGPRHLVAQLASTSFNPLVLKLDRKVHGVDGRTLRCSQSRLCCFSFFFFFPPEENWNPTRHGHFPTRCHAYSVVVLALTGCPLSWLSGSTCICVLLCPLVQHHPLHPSIAQKKRTECCCINLKSSCFQSYCIAHFRI